MSLSALGVSNAAFSQYVSSVFENFSSTLCRCKWSQRYTLGGTLPFYVNHTTNSCTQGARPITRTPENKKLLISSFGITLHTDKSDDYRGAYDVNASYHLFVAFYYGTGTFRLFDLCYEMCVCCIYSLKCSSRPPCPRVCVPSS